MHMTTSERSQFLWITGQPDEDIAALADAEDQIDLMERQIEALQAEVADLQEWKDGAKAAELDAAKEDHEKLAAKHGRCMEMMRRVMAQLTSDQCKTAAGRKELAKEINTHLIANR
jgi:predicted RNA-binding protein YlqC (UPF0109 family)